MTQRAIAARKQKKAVYFDYGLLFVIIFLVCFGLVMLYSTSSYIAESKFGDSRYYLKKQIGTTLLGMAGMLIISNIDYHVWKRFGTLPYFVALLACAFVVVKGVEINGAKRWIRLGPITIQPSEFAKLAVILFLALLISKIPGQMKNIGTVVKILLFVLPLIGVIAYTNLSTAIIIAGIAVSILFVASPKSWYFVAGGVVAVAMGSFALFFLSNSYRGERIQIWLHPEKYTKGYQTLQGLYAIGSGGLFGKGLGESIQKLGYLPEAQNDMIFSIICEELGIFGAVCVVLLFLLMIWRLMIIANNASDLYGALIVSGIMVHIALQVILNIAVVTNTMPNTGITLPFISYGGTSVIFLLAEMGLALNISKGIRIEGSVG